MKLVTTSVAVLAVLVCAGTAFAGSPGVNKRQHNQQKRIVQGIRSGEMTKREVYRLEKEQRRIAKKERKFKADGELTRRERAILNHDLNHARGGQALQGLHVSGMRINPASCMQEYFAEFSYELWELNSHNS